jgi:hypothetical protein
MKIAQRFNAGTMAIRIRPSPARDDRSGPSVKTLGYYHQPETALETCRRGNPAIRFDQRSAPTLPAQLGEFLPNG